MLSNKYRFLIFLFLNISIAFSQSSLYTPLNFQDAYEKGTRSYDGKPGIEYWQNKADYQLTASIDPATRTLTGVETILYNNNSPDTLDRIVFRLYQNINKIG